MKTLILHLHLNNINVKLHWAKIGYEQMEAKTNLPRFPTPSLLLKEENELM